VQFLPESARYLVASGRRGEAIETLAKASKMNGKTLPPGQLVESKKVSFKGDKIEHIHPDVQMTPTAVSVVQYGGFNI
jgi:hypothetical protein